MTTKENLHQMIIQEFSKTVEMFNISPSDARLFTVLYLHNKPMTLDEMSTALGKSKTSVNTGIRNLSELALVKQVWKKGTRKDWYTTDQELYQKFMQTYIDKWVDQTANHKQTLYEIEQIFLEKQCSDDDRHVLEEKLSEMINFHKRIEQAFSKIKPKQ
ncbi:DNA-binding transcriptional regulator GbsR (MarR family) [Natronobacillus azotifigens]|uniref:HTH-type transcriptional regulator n=1 Tax=Natronobacillus azotifigens TaxID=472978 RepID=A0A9J6RDP1_9BACI|nr:transcriptional regulator [Natronobacillus azotifigens]MCZ0703313.1 transcriptional regulator [Natronobacillus azotifigens]